MAGSIGVRVDGVDVANDASLQLVEALRAILDEHLVIHLPGQGHVTPEQQSAFAAMWGDVITDPRSPSLGHAPRVMEVGEPNRRTTVWHQDLTFVERPPSVSMLLARDLPDSGGDMMWANQYAAYESLSPGLREVLDGLFAVHHGPPNPIDRWSPRDQIASVHPLVVTHERTGRRALFANARSVARLDGWTTEESAPLLDYLFRVASRNELTCRHRWSVGDLMIADNRATLHCSVADLAPGERRTLHWVLVAGDAPR
jgi:taurine dioxygenase